MSIVSKVLIFLGVVLAIGATTFIIYKQQQIAARQEAIEKQMVAQKELADNIMRSMSQYTTKKDMEAFAKQNNINMQVIAEDLEKLNASVAAVNITTTVSHPQVASNLPSTSTTPGDNPNPPPKEQDPYGYLKNTQKLQLNEQFANASVPIGEVGFSAWKDKPWSVNLSQREYKATTVIGTDENQRLYTYNKLTIKVNNKDHDLKITTSTTQQVYPEAKMSWFNPRLYIGADVGLNVGKQRGEFSPNVNVAISSYGKYKNAPDFTFLQFGVGYGLDQQRPQIVITPLTYNVGKHIPLMNNTHIGPSVNINTGGDIIVGGGIRVGL